MMRLFFDFMALTRPQARMTFRRRDSLFLIASLALAIILVSAAAPFSGAQSATAVSAPPDTPRPVISPTLASSPALYLALGASDKESVGGAGVTIVAQAAGTAPHNSASTISLAEAIRRAQANAPAFAASLAESRATSLDRSIARAALLPTAVYHNQFLYTQGNGQRLPGQVGQAPRFIANNTVHEYMSQAAVTETVGLLQLAELRRADAASARARAELEIARRGLVGTVVGLYYSSLAGAQKVSVAERALNEANTFTDLTQKRESAREVAHADVVKAQLQQQQRQRDLLEARLAADRAHLELGVLLFADPRTPFSLEPARNTAALPDRATIQTAATTGNPELRSAFATLRLGSAAVLTARGAYLPALVLNYTYGIDAPQFARRGPDSIPNLGYSASVTLDIPIWDWLATEHRVKQSEIRRDALRVALTAAQRRVIATFDEYYAEAAVAREQSASLETSVHTADESLRLTKLRYSQGEATVLEVVDAQNALTIAENSREDGIVRYHQAIANLQRLTPSL